MSKRRLAKFLLDASLVVTSGFLAVFLRENLDLSFDKIMAGWVYHVAILASTICIIPLFGIDRSAWHFNSLSDHLKLSAACFAIVGTASFLTLFVSRFEGVARSVPIIHYVLATFILIAVRIIFRKMHDDRRGRQSNAPLSFNLAEFDQSQHLNVLVVGINRLTETYLEAVKEFASKRIRVVGLVGSKDRHAGRLIATFPVLGIADDVQIIVRDLQSHGIFIDRIVVTCDFYDLPEKARWALLHLEASSNCELHFFAEQLDIFERKKTNGDTNEGSLTTGECVAPLRFSFSDSQFRAINNRSYWIAKRVIDATAALLLIVLLSPLMIGAAIIGSFFIGLPVTFWQQRPGLRGVPFRLYKFRTMRPAHDANGRPLTDQERLSAVGNILRRYRLDELPQLFSILIGDMSFIGPRPLLPRDQASQDRARLLVRPGLTGWAQVVGGRDVTADDKAALDVWYVKNASLLLDAKIVFRTVPMIVVGETIHRPLIEDARQELRRDGILTS